MADQIAIKLLAGSQLDSRTDIAAKLADLDAEITAAEASEGDHEADADALSPGDIRKLKTARTKLKKALKEIDGSLLATARRTLEAMLADDAPSPAIGALHNRFDRLTTDHFAAIERDAVIRYDDLVDKYGTTLRSFEAARDEATARIDAHLEQLGYG